MKPVALACSHIALSYGTGRGKTAVLKDITLAIQAGEFFALLGPSGSGKSSLLRLIAGFNAADAGTLTVDGKDITRVPPWQRNIGMVFQNYALWPHMSVAKNVAFGLEERRLPRADIKRKVAEVLALVDLSDYAERRPNQLSGGQQQRVALARTLAIEPTLLLLDEPLSNLDAKLRVQMRQELKALQRRLGITTIFVTHDQEEALTSCDRIAVMDQGVIQQIGTPVELFDAPANRFVANFIGTMNFIEGTIIKAADGVIFESALLGKTTLAAHETATSGCLTVRPHAISLSGGAPQSGDLPGDVREREFLGEFVRYRVHARGVDLTVDQAHHVGSEVFERGQHVGVRIPENALRLVR